MRMKKTAVMMMFLWFSVSLTRLYALRGRGLSKTRSMIFHPPTGLCVLRTSFMSDLNLGPCTKSDDWYYAPTKNLDLVGLYFCLQVNDIGKPAKLGTICTNSNAKWDVVSGPKSYMISKTNSGEAVCLDSDSNNKIVTTACKCLNSDSNCDPTSQWFKLVEKADG